MQHTSRIRELSSACHEICTGQDTVETKKTEKWVKFRDNPEVSWSKHFDLDATHSIDYKEPNRRDGSEHFFFMDPGAEGRRQ